MYLSSSNRERATATATATRLLTLALQPPGLSRPDKRQFGIRDRSPEKKELFCILYINQNQIIHRNSTAIHCLDDINSYNELFLCYLEYRLWKEFLILETHRLK